jgi:hypothetical protein
MPGRVCRVNRGCEACSASQPSPPASAMTSVQNSTSCSTQPLKSCSPRSST